MKYTSIGIALLIAALDWVAVARRWKTLEYIAKPGVMVALLVWLGWVHGLQGAMFWFAAGLVFSMCGDIFLMLPREQFIAGLVSFLLAHICYLVGFNLTAPPLNVVSLILLAFVGLVALRIYRGIANGLMATGQGELRLPVLIYSAILSLMLLSALFTLLRPEWSSEAALLASGGALLFFTSDTLLAWNKFVSALPYARLAVIVSYHIGQTMITLGAALHFLA